MKKYQLIEAVGNRCGGGSYSADVMEKYRPGVIRLVLGNVFDDLITRVYQNSSSPSKSDLDAYSKFYSISALSTADATGQKYFEIPTTTKKLLQLPNNHAIRQIWTVESTPRKCLYRDMGQRNVYLQMEVGTYLTNPRYEVIGKNIYLDSNIGSVTSLTAYLVVPFSEYQDDEDLPAPLENNETIIQQAYQIMMNMPPEDKITDDNLEQE